MTGDGPSYSFSTPFLNQFHAFNVSSEPSTSDQTVTPLTTGRMKRKLDRGDEQVGDIPVPRPKRALYEDRMSKKLWNFHIGENNFETYGAGTQTPAIEEVGSDWGFGDVEFSADPIVEEPTCNMSDESPVMSAEGIVLSNDLRKFLKSCRERDGDFLFKPSRTGKELVLYQSPISKNIVAPDIRDRIEEIQNWDEEELDDDEDRSKQIVSFPDSKSSSPIKSDRKKSISPTSRRSRNKPANLLQANAPTRPRFAQSITANCIMNEEAEIKNSIQEENEMEID